MSEIRERAGMGKANGARLIDNIHRLMSKVGVGLAGGESTC